MRYGLLGEKLGHSFSKEIHEALSNMTYEMIEKAPEEMEEFMKEKNFSAINVTIPYKEKVIPYLDSIDERAKRIHAVNTIVNKNGKLYGYNTDYDGIVYLLHTYDICVTNKTVAILGSGGTSKTATAVMEDTHAKRILHVSRSAKDGFITYDELYQIADTIDIIINTTPLGMYPHNEAVPIDISRFTNCSSVIDVIFNPLHTTLMQQAEAHGKKAAGGLGMLIAQGIKAHELFIDTKYDISVYDQLFQKIQTNKQNIVLIGMPTCGKSTIAKLLSDDLHIPYVDIDEQIIKQEGKPISELFSEYGEDYFRNIEYQITKDIAKGNHQIIATGGGIIKDRRNIDHLKQNGIIFFIDRSLEKLQNDDTRPLANTSDKVRILYQERYPLYSKYADYIIPNNDDIQTTMKMIKEKLL